MCNYVDMTTGLCDVSNSQCPYVYWCHKVNGWRENKSMPFQCRQKQQLPPPKGYYKVVNYRKGYLYIDIDDRTIKLPNPYEDVPTYVKLAKQKDGNYKIKGRDNNG